jgi:hypothetical protein
MNRLRRCLWLVLAAIPAIFPLVLILKFGVNFHSSDEWEPDMAGFLIKVYTHQATFADLFAQHNEHRPAVVRVCYLLLNTFTRWNNIPQLLATWVFVCITSVCILRIGMGTSKFSRAILPWFVCNLLIFTPAQLENWMWGIGMQNVMPAAFLFLGLVAAFSKRLLPTRLVLCLLLAIMATYTDGDGMLTWPILGAAIIWSVWKTGRKIPVWLPAALIVACVAVVVSYFVGYVKPPTRGIEVYSSNPAAIARYFLAFLGNPFVKGIPASPATSGIFMGTALLLLWLGAMAYFVRAWRHGERDLTDGMFVWLLPGAYAVMSGILAAASRAGAGPLHAALTTRYISYSVYLTVSLVYLIPLIADDLAESRVMGAGKGWSALPITGMAVILLIQAVVLIGATGSFEYENAREREGKAALLLGAILPDNPQLAKLVNPNPSVLVAQARQLSDLGYLDPPLIASADAESIRAADLGTAPAIIGRLDALYLQGGRIQTVGWALVPRTHFFADAVVLTYENQNQESIIFTSARMGLQRPDLVPKMGSEFEWSGWLADFPISRLPAQPKNLRIKAWALDADSGATYLLEGVGVWAR